MNRTRLLVLLSAALACTQWGCAGQRSCCRKCQAPTCCAPAEPTCCAPAEPTCCAPAAPICCAPAKSICCAPAKPICCAPAKPICCAPAKPSYYGPSGAAPQPLPPARETAPAEPVLPPPTVQRLPVTDQPAPDQPEPFVPEAPAAADTPMLEPAPPLPPPQSSAPRIWHYNTSLLRPLE